MRLVLPPLRPGLVLNMSTRSPHGFLIRKVLSARSPITSEECPNHTSIVVEHKDQLWIGDAQPRRARLTPIEQYQAELDRKFIYRLQVLEVVGITQDEEFAAAQWWVDNVCGKTYDYMAFPRLLFKALVGNWIDTVAGWEWAWFCSEGVAQAYVEECRVDPIQKKNPTPLTFWKRWREGKFSCLWEGIQ